MNSEDTARTSDLDEGIEPGAAPNVPPLQRALSALREARAKLDAIDQARSEPIAVTGMGCRFPGGGQRPEAFFRALEDGVDAVGEIPPERWPADAIPGARSEARWAALLDSVDRFDATFFGISPREAAQLDPQHRLLLECVWEALEDAGEQTERLMGSRTGVFIGMNSNADYLQLLLRGAKQIDPYCGTGNSAGTAAGRISYTLGLEGPCMTIDTACSSSLVAIHLACQSLRNRECELALAGGVHLILAPTSAAIVAEMGVLSPDGRCRVFDAGASGYVRGEGCGVVVLKRLSDAERDKDPILALIRGSAVNQDGRSTGRTRSHLMNRGERPEAREGSRGILEDFQGARPTTRGAQQVDEMTSTPNVLSQQALLRQALESARVSAEEISYVETHGTGNPLGDSVELEALKAVLGEPRHDGARCALGALKSNIGHLEAAAGVAGLIKIVLCLRREVIPRNLHFDTLNPRISLEGTPFVIPTESLPWKAGQRPRVAGVSSFGISGTNAHLIVQEAPRREEAAVRAEEASTYVLPLSARSAEALGELARVYRGWLGSPGCDAHLHDIAYTAGARRSHLEHRLAVVGSSREELCKGLAVLERGMSSPGRSTGKAPGATGAKVAFVLSGQGSQWVGMGRALLDDEPAFRDMIEACDVAIRREAGFSVLEELRADEAGSRLGELDVVQPVLFAISVALASWWRSRGVEPDAVVGHSMGEVAAAYVAGALSLDDAARVICRRSALLKRLVGAGGMALVDLTAADAERAIGGYGGRITVGGINSPRLTVLSGELGALETLMAELRERGLFCQLVSGTSPTHGPWVETLVPELRGLLEGIQPKPGVIPIYSTVTNSTSDGSDFGVEYWVRNMREPVLFAHAIERLLGDGHTLFIELSPHPILMSSVNDNVRKMKLDGLAVPSLLQGKDARRTLLNSLGRLYTSGYDVDWKKGFSDGGRVVRAPGYPWQKKRYWVEPSAPAPSIRSAVQRSLSGHPLLGGCVTPSTHPEERVAPGEHLRREPAKGRPFRLEIAEPGILERLALREMTRCPPGPGEVEIEVEAAGLNFMDVMKAMGTDPGLPPGPAPLGGECAGRVVALGQGVVDLEVGQEVIATCQSAFATHATVPARFVVPKPKNLSFEQAATVPLVFTTAWYALVHVGKAHRGESILIHSASGGTGLAAIQVARLLGLEIFATAGSEDKRWYLRAMGLDHVMDSRSLSFADDVMRATNGRGVDLVLNSLTGDALVKNLDVLAPFGRLLELAKRDAYDNVPLGLSPFQKCLSYTLIDVARLVADRPDLFTSVLAQVMQRLGDGTLEPLPLEPFAISEAERAFRKMAQAEHIGKIVMSLKDPEARIVPARRERAAVSFGDGT